jgi:hypothetical protein
VKKRSCPQVSEGVFAMGAMVETPALLPKKEHVAESFVTTLPKFHITRGFCAAIKDKIKDSHLVDKGTP